MKNIVVVGAGAAGIFAAIHAAQKGNTVTILERGLQPLRKVKISGGGRCNVTHACFDPQTLATYYPRGGPDLIEPFSRFGPQQMLEWLKKQKVLTKKESDGRIFPQSNLSTTIIECFLNACKAKHISLRYGTVIETITREKTIILKTGETIAADVIILATGAHPSGYQLAKDLGHTIIPPIPSLFTFNLPSSPLLDLTGLSVADVILKSGHFKQRGSLLITHWGFSGPVALKLSAWAADLFHQRHYRAPIHVNWLPEENPSTLLKKLPHMSKERRPLPKKLWQRQLRRLDISPPLKKASPQQIQSLRDLLLKDTFFMEGKTTHKQEFVTCGGVDLKEINFKTMESLLVPQLFFAGEILNIDGLTGGFNFQNAWTTGYIAGKSSL